jgi:hypothetical protein
MTGIRLSNRRWPTALLLALSAIAIGAVFGSSHSGSAAITVKPTNQTGPVISGTAQEGQTLTTSDGTWTGTTPIAFTYQWSRCDTTGKNCAAISGATRQFYVLQHVDVGNTLTAVVTGTNSDGTDAQGTTPTAVVTAASAATAPTGCPTGTGGIQIADLSAPARLQIDQQTVIPGLITPAATTIQTHFRVTACGGRPVQGALVYATAVPFNQYSIPPEGTTAADGTVDLTMNQRTGFPAARKQQLLVVFARARKPGEPIAAGVSSSLLVSFHVSLHSK